MDSGANLHVAAHVPGAVAAFADRRDAGDKLARFVAPAPDPEALVLALPRGGVPVAVPLAEALGCDLHPILVRKLPIPSEPEMGFGAVTVDGTLTLNEPIVRAFGIGEATVQSTVEEVRVELERRSREYPGGWPLPEMTRRRIWLVDDGLATGFTAIAAIAMIRAHRPESLAVATPCAPSGSLARVSSEADETYCLFEQSGSRFAVASFYQRFPDLTDAEVVRALHECARPYRTEGSPTSEHH